MDDKEREREKAKKTEETLGTHRLIVRCNQCGSTAVDLSGNARPDALACDSCGNTMAWDADRFTLIRYDDLRPGETLVGIERAVAETNERAKARACGETP